MKPLLVLLLGLACVVAQAQAPTTTRLRGTIARVDGPVLHVTTREGREVQLALAPDTAVVTARRTTLAELKDQYVGVTSREEAGGRLVAVEVHAIPPQVPAGHTAWDLAPGSSMTNAHLAERAQVTGGDEVTLRYASGEKKVLVPPGTPVVDFAAGTRADLRPGETIFTTATLQGEGRYATGRVAVSKDGVKPPQ